jgi:hypothetical protein
MQGKYRESPLFRPFFRPKTADKALRKLVFFAKFPNKWNRELFSMIREFPIDFREFPGCSRERAKRQAVYPSMGA